jgi:iron complex outermembrane recepter protein
MVRSRLKSCLAAMLVVAVAPSRADPPTALEPVIVTGSRVVTGGFESASPVAVVPGEELARRGAISVEQALQELPQFVPAAGSTSNSPGNDGQANLSLRGIGAAQTLVLLDGRRVTPADGRGAVDVNLIPAALIESVEVVTGGAAAAYGSDAVAGVVNFRLRPSFEGLQADARWSQAGAGDATEYSAELTGGTGWAGGRGSLAFSAGYARRERLRQVDRDFSAVPLAYYPDETGGVGPGGAFLQGFSGIPAEGLNIVFASQEAFDRVFERYGYPPGSVPYQGGISINADGTLFTFGDGINAGTVVNFRGPQDPRLFNDRRVSLSLAPWTALQLPLERKTLLVRSSFDWTDGATVEAQLLYADYETRAEIGPPGTGIVLASPGNPYVPADLAELLSSRVNPDVPFRMQNGMRDLPNRVATNDRQLIQATLAAEGRLRGEWRYEAYLQWGRNERREHRSGNALTGEIEALVNSPDGGLSACGSFNLFGDRPIDPACLALVTTDAVNRIEVEQRVLEAVVDGSLLSVPTGTVRAAFGVFHKRDEFRFDADPLAALQLPAIPGIIGPRPALAGFPSAPDRRGREQNTDLFAELRMPLLASEGIEDRATLGLGYRRSSYDRAGDFDAWKADLSLRASEAVRLRGSYQRAIRAPGVDELFYPQLLGQFFVTPPDPCDIRSAQRTGPDAAAVRALCLEQGLPSVLIDSFGFPLARVEGVGGGNTALVAEQSDSVTAGLVLTLPRLAGDGALHLSLDWYRIELDRAVGRWPTDTAIQRCFDPAYNPAFDAANAWCTFFERSSQDGTIFTREIDRNAGGILTSGVDLQLSWRQPLGTGRLGIEALVGWVDRWELLEPGGTRVDLAGTLGGRTLGGALPRWRPLLTLDYAWQRWRAFTSLRYIDRMRDAEYRDFEVPSATYVDVGVSLELTGADDAGWVLQAGVENAGDETPPLFPSTQQANTDPSRYDVVGRRFRFGASYRF